MIQPEDVLTWLGSRKEFGPIHLVGGTVRDELLGRFVSDIDCALSVPPHQAAQRCSAELDGTLVPLDPVRGCFRVVAGNLVIDFSHLHPDGIVADLAHRDYTVNAMARRLDASPSFVIDPFGGRADLSRRSLRMVAEENLVQDPLRILRAYRLAAQLEFSVEGDTRTALARNASTIRAAAAERLTDEWRLMLACPHSFRQLLLMDEDGVLARLWPELDLCRGTPQNDFHHRDVLGHSLETIEKLEDLLNPSTQLPDEKQSWRDHVVTHPWRVTALKTAALLHDIGKLATAAVSDQGTITFHRHERAGVDLLAGAFARWRFSQKEQTLIVFLVRHHMVLGALARDFQRSGIRQTSLVRWLSRWRDDLYALALLALADRAAARGRRSLPTDEFEGVRVFVSMLVALYEDAVAPRLRSPRLLSGHDLMHIFGMGPGPLLGKILQRVNEKTVLGELETREEALEAVRSWLEQGICPHPVSRPRVEKQP